MLDEQQRIRINLPELYPKQFDAIYAPERYAVIEASTKAGKTVGCLVWQGHRVLEDKKSLNHWWIAPVYPQAKIAYSRAKAMFPREVYTPNDSDSRLTFANGAKWWFKSGEKSDNLYGEDVADAVIDEATRMREESWHAVRSTLTATQGHLRIIGNVKGRRNWAYRLARRAESGADGMHFAKLTAWDAVAAGVLDRAEIEDAQAILPDHVFQELYLAEPSDDGGNPFGLAAIEACMIDSQSRDEPVAIGVDLAKSVDWTVVIGLDKHGRQCLFDRFQADWGQTRQRVLDLIGRVPTVVDSTGVGDPIVEDMIREAPNVEGFKFSSTSKQQLMEGLASAIQRQRVSFSEPVMVAELQSFEYEYTPRGGVRYSAPPGVHDDCVCALALAWDVLRRDPGPVTFELSGVMPASYIEKGIW